MTAGPTRFTRQSPCPICGGYDQAPRGQGIRCHGFLSSDGKYIHCSREEYAGDLPIEPNSNTYAHRRTGRCRCGSQHGQPSAKRRIVATYDYHDERGNLLFQTVRYEPKGFAQRRPNGRGGWTWNLKGVRRVLYQLPLLAAAGPGSTVYLVEGEKDADLLTAQGLIATTNPMGAGKWESSYNESLRDRHVVILPDDDPPGRQHANAVASSLHGVAASVKIVHLPNPAQVKGFDVADWFSSGGTVDELHTLVNATPVYEPPQPETIEPRTLDQVIETFRKWLHLPDPGVLEVALGTVAANHLDGDPVWVLLVGPAGAGKTELINAISHLPNIYPVSTLTEASLLSGSSRRDWTAGTSGGILRQIGSFGILAIKDLTSILSHQADIGMMVTAALREIYDGSWVRHVGTDGGQTLAWSGKVGLIGGCTPAIDRYHTSIALLGERFAFYRTPENDRETLGYRSLNHVGKELEMRDDLAKAVKGLFASIQIQSHELTEDEKAFLVALAVFTTYCRSAVERDSRDREILFIPEAEMPTRFIGVLARLANGLLSIGVSREHTWELVRKVALDSMPSTRRKAIETLLNSPQPLSTSDIAERIQHPSVTTVRRALEDLACHHMVHRHAMGQGRATLWEATAEARRLWTRFLSLPTAPSNGAVENSDISDSQTGFPEILCGVSKSEGEEETIETHTNTHDKISGKVYVNLAAAGPVAPSADSSLPDGLDVGAFVVLDDGVQAYVSDVFLSAADGQWWVRMSTGREVPASMVRVIVQAPPGVEDVPW